MTYTLTAEQLTDLRADIADEGASPAFSDTELNRLYNRAEGDYNRTVVYALRQLLASHAKLHDYAAGQSQESLQQVYAHVRDLLSYWERIAGEFGGALYSGTLALQLDEADPSTESEWS
jgi:hypothetical protein